MRKRGRLSAAAALAGTAGLAALVILIAVSRGSDAETAGVRSYAEAIKPLAFEGGRIVQQGLKPALVDLREGRTTAEAFIARATAWKDQFIQIRQDVAAIPHPEHLDRIAETYDAALAAYAEAIDAFTAAARLKDTAARDKALNAGADAAERADKIYDRARELLAKKLSQAGLDPSEYR